VTLSWTAASGATTYTLKRSLVTGGPYTDFVQPGIAGTTFTDGGLTNGATYFYVVSGSNGGGEGPNSTQVSSTPSAGPTWSDQDIGTVGAAGSFTQSGTVFTVKGAGADIWTTTDAFHFVYRNITGNATIIAKVTTVTNTDPGGFTKAGIMIREGLAANTRNVAMITTPTAANAYRFQTRTTAVTGTTGKVQSAGTGTAPVWFKLIRSGTSLSAFFSTNGTTYTQLGTTQTYANLASTLQIGLAITSHADPALATAAFDSVTITSP
jgi:hypothetical protein